MSIIQSSREPNPLAFPGDDAQIIEARRRLLLQPLRRPAEGLILVSSLSIAAIVIYPGLIAQSNDIGEQGLGLTSELIDGWRTHWWLLLPIILINSFILYAATQMRSGRSYLACMIGSLLALLSYPPFFVLSIPFGLWSLYLLRTQEIRQAFTKQRITTITQGSASTPLPASDL